VSADDSLDDNIDLLPSEEGPDDQGAGEDLDEGYVPRELSLALSAWGTTAAEDLPRRARRSRRADMRVLGVT